MIAVFANGTFYEAFDVETPAQAFDQVKELLGGDVADDFEYARILASEAEPLRAWWANGGDASAFDYKAWGVKS